MKREKKKFFKNRTQMVIYLILFAICIYLFIAIGKIDFHKDEESQGLVKSYKKILYTLFQSLIFFLQYLYPAYNSH